MARVGKDKQPRKHAGRARKEKTVEELLVKIDASNGLVFADYQGLTNQQTENIKKELEAAQATMAVTKNTLLKISLGKSTKYADLARDMPIDRPTATLFLGEDVVGPLKAIAKAFKEFNLPKLKFGIIDGQALDEAQLLKLSTLPNRETLLAQFVGTLNSPITGLVVTLNATLQKFVLTLDAIAKTKPADLAAAPAPVAEQHVVETTPATEEATQSAPDQPATEHVPVEQPVVTEATPAETTAPEQTIEASAEPSEPIAEAESTNTTQAPSEPAPETPASEELTAEPSQEPESEAKQEQPENKDPQTQGGDN